MCWSETTSIITFTFGSILNCLAYAFLKYRNPLQPVYILLAIRTFNANTGSDHLELYKQWY